MSWDIHIRIWGNKFYPSKVQADFSEAYDVGSILNSGRMKGQVSDHGVAIIHGQDRNIVDLCAKANAIKEALFSSGASEIELSILREYENQCNEELSVEEISAIAMLGCHLCYTAYQDDSE